MRSVGTRDTRGTSVAIGMFLQFLAPVWVALLAPRVSRVPTERIVYPALAIAFGGLVVILAPSLLGEGIRLSAGGVAAESLIPSPRRDGARMTTSPPKAMASAG